MSEALEKGTVAQVKSDGVPTAIHTMNCAKAFHVERLLRIAARELGLEAKLAPWERGLRQSHCSVLCLARGEGAQKLGP